MTEKEESEKNKKHLQDWKLTEQISSKICCKGVARYVLKCPRFQKFVCFNHIRDFKKLKGEKDFELFCFHCFWEVEN